jgi:hypothetical protein
VEGGVGHEGVLDECTPPPLGHSTPLILAGRAGVCCCCPREGNPLWPATLSCSLATVPATAPQPRPPCPSLRAVQTRGGLHGDGTCTLTT